MRGLKEGKKNSSFLVGFPTLTNYLKWVRSLLLSNHADFFLETPKGLNHDCCWKSKAAKPHNFVFQSSMRA